MNDAIAKGALARLDEISAKLSRVDEHICVLVDWMRSISDQLTSMEVKMEGDEEK